MNNAHESIFLHHAGEVRGAGGNLPAGRAGGGGFRRAGAGLGTGRNRGFSGHRSAFRPRRHNGFKLDGEAADDRSGVSVSAAGDVNGDGVVDLIVGAFLADPNGNSFPGRSYVVFGTTSDVILRDSFE